jgi:hypothetical protein
MGNGKWLTILVGLGVVLLVYNQYVASGVKKTEFSVKGSQNKKKK